MRGKQAELFPRPKQNRIAYGGEASRGKRKVARPFDPKQAIHAVFRAEGAKRGTAWSMHCRRHKGLIYLTAWKIADDCGVRIYRMVNVGNHLHIVLKSRSKRAFQKFLRVFAGRVAVLVTGARRGLPIAQNKKFWTFPVYTKIITWGRHFRLLDAYMRKNLREAEGAHSAVIYPDFQLFALG